MAFHVNVQGGEDDGKSFRVDGHCIIGRAPSSDVILVQPDIAWEHAALQDLGGRLFLQNLSSAGTRYQGRPVTSDVRVNHGDEIQLSENSTLVVEERVGEKQGIEVSPKILLALIVALAGLAFGAVNMLQEEEQPVPRITIDNWRKAHERLVTRMSRWEQRGEMPEEALVLFKDAWRLEIAYNPRAAVERWDTLRSLVLTLRLPGSESYDRRTIAEASSTSPRALHVLMDWDQETSLTMDPTWSSDESYASALGWFLQMRASSARKKLETQQ